MSDVENLWSDAVKQPLIQYSDSGDVAINLIYSENQKFTDNEQQLSQQINEMRKKYYSMRMNYQEESLEFQRNLSQYNKTFTEYAQKVNEYNLRLSRLTNSGIVSRDDDEQLKNLKKEMEFLEKKLDPLEHELTLEEQKLNRLSEELNNYADEVNEYVFQYRNRYAQSRTFYQGFYTHVGNQKKINIYQFDNTDKLRLVLTHEFGHALGLSHTDNPVSIMNYNMQLQLDQRLKLSDEDISAVKDRCTPSQASM
jgi:predicted Zn-dependent protease